MSCSEPQTSKSEPQVSRKSSDVRSGRIKKDFPLCIRIAKEIDDRLTKASQRLDLSKNDIAHHALRAAVEAIEAADYKIRWPLNWTEKGVGENEGKDL
jgi:hypothetical protein